MDEVHSTVTTNYCSHVPLYQTINRLLYYLRPNHQQLLAACLAVGILYMLPQLHKLIALFPGLPVQNKSLVLFCTGKPGNEANKLLFGA